MQLVFLDRLNLAYKDYGYVDKDFDITLDLVIIQKSTFIINKTKLNASIGDIDSEGRTNSLHWYR
jgi:hypothetical protein